MTRRQARRAPTDATPSFEEAVLAVVAGLQRGEIVSYGDVAREAGRPGAARAVGQVMARSDGLPWWRVVYADGRLPVGKEDAAAAQLRAEGHRVMGARVEARRSVEPPTRSRRAVGPRGAS